MEQAKLVHFKQKLLARKEQLEQQVKSIEEGGLHQSMRDSIGELSFYDNHPADLGNEVFERGKDLALRDNALIQLKNVEETLQRIEAGTYGTCQKCHRRIDEERLEAVPETPYCYECRLQVEKDGRPRVRPVEEEVIRPPFGGAGLDDTNYFDGEDTWQMVARYGTSDALADWDEDGGL
ncbi:MAG TPA: conjugal transfer protein TraR [Clostridia bacterium]|nr:conjugal transfer protein TraR [Clostridia bacterium]